MNRKAIRGFGAIVAAGLLAGCAGDVATRYTDTETLHYSGPPTAFTCFWQVPAFPELPAIGPERAHGVVLYAHGQRARRRPGWIWPPPQLLYTRFAKQGWDVIKVQRNERCEGGWTRTGGRYVGDFAKRVAELKSAGYRRIIAAGQSVGAAVALGASGRTGDIDGVFAFALSHGRGSCRRADQFRHEMIGFHERHIRNAIRAAKAPRIVIVLAKDDHCIGHSFTPLVNAELSKKKGFAWVYLDETSAVSGHGAAQRSGFDRIYGECLSGFMNDDAIAIAPGRITCQ